MKNIAVGDQLLHTDGRTDWQTVTTGLAKLILSFRNFTKTSKRVHFRDRIFSLLQAVHFIETQFLRRNCDTGFSELKHRQKAKYLPLQETKNTNPHNKRLFYQILGALCCWMTQMGCQELKKKKSLLSGPSKNVLTWLSAWLRSYSKDFHVKAMKAYRRCKIIPPPILNIRASKR
jgi:hypothetical protein